MFETYKQAFPTLEHDIVHELHMFKIYRDIFEPMVTDCSLLVNQALDVGKSVLVEGANAHLLDIDFGTYPFVTSSNCSIGGVVTGLGIPAHRIGSVVAVMKAYCTRVGFGPFPTELKQDPGDYLCERGFEYGTTTGRKRRCGWLDLVMMRSCVLVNGPSG